ncbi:MAG: sn-glycerol-3-phosphate ABC transporter substrate-binding protein UgpB [Spirochaetaceae bacterium]
MKRLLLTLVVLLLSFSLAYAGGQQEEAAEPEPEGPITIEWWHAMGGALGEKVEELASDFNESQDEYEIDTVYRGDYSETMTSAIAAFRSGEPPHIVQMYEVGTQTMMAAEDAIKPVYELMEESGEPFDPEIYIPAVTGYYTTPDGRMLSLPFNSSTPVLWYNKDAFEEAGLDPDDPPETWPEVAEYSEALVDAGYKGFSTAWISWIHLENLSAWHDIPLATRANGFEGMDAELLYNSEDHVRHVEALADWQEDDIFVYGGRTNEGNALFSGGEVGMYTESSAGYGGFNDSAEFEFDTAMLPYWPDAEGAPQNTIIGGASLWVMEGHSDEEYRGVAQFFNYLSTPEVQADWHESTGYLPITEDAYELAKEQGLYEETPALETAILQMTRAEPTDNSKGLRLGNYSEIRDINYEELEALFDGQKTAQEALDDAVERGNEVLREFERQNE